MMIMYGIYQGEGPVKRGVRFVFRRSLLSILPRRLRHEAIRRAITYSTDLPPQLRFKVAETSEELAAAYRILHDCYVDIGAEDPRPGGMRITKYFALPSTTTLIATWDGKVVATMSIVRRTAMGLSIEELFDISEICEGGKVVAEISALAISRDFRGSRGSTLLPLCKFFWDFTSRYMKLDRMVIQVNPSIADFYESILLFKRVSNTVKSNPHVKNCPAIALWADLEEVKVRGKELYNHRRPEQNAYRYFIESTFSNFQFPKRTFEKSSDPVMTPLMLNYFFNIRSSVFTDLSERERMVLRGLYPPEGYTDVLPRVEGNHRKSIRHLSQMEATLEATDVSKLRIVEVSETGLRVAGPLLDKAEFEINVAISETKRAKLRVQRQWRDSSSQISGLKIVEHDDVWRDYIKYLNADFHSLATRRSA